MNVAFHALVGIALTQETAARLGAPGGGGSGGSGGSGAGARAAAPAKRAWAWAAAFGLAVLSHGILDALPHYYPLGHAPDAVVSILLFAVWLGLVPRWMRLPLVAVCTGALMPDIVDWVPRDLNRHLGLRLPTAPIPLFPWHWRSGSGSFPGRLAGPLWIESLTNHAIVLAFCAAALIRTRHLLRRRG